MDSNQTMDIPEWHYSWSLKTEIQQSQNSILVATHTKIDEEDVLKNLCQKIKHRFYASMEKKKSSKQAMCQ